MYTRRWAPSGYHLAHIASPSFSLSYYYFFFLDEHRFLHIEIGKWDEMRNDVVSIAKERK